ncbi:flagellar hook-basal body complex protein FliE [Pueribacillus sp. YX66]|uniref:flagellar hook-basal body complex protein FliE n=1 Tax=Pueribacillus sp. YX66 TaxID=3229242 RepID=UPI00358D9D55
MEQVGLTSLFSNQKVASLSENRNTPHKVQQQFSQMLNDAVQKVNDTQVASDRETEKLINGQTTNLHDVMITAEKAAVTLQVSLEVRNKIIEAYQEVMRMPL